MVQLTMQTLIAIRLDDTTHLLQGLLMTVMIHVAD